VSFRTKRRPPTPFDINQLHLIVALSRQKPRVRVPSSPPILSSTCKELAICVTVQFGPVRPVLLPCCVRQREVQRAAVTAPDQPAAIGSNDARDSSASATCEHNIQFGRVTCGCAFLAVECPIHWTVADERNAVVGSPAQPCLHRRGDVDENVLVLVSDGERHAGGDRGSERRRQVCSERVLRPRAVDVVHVKAACGRHRIDVELQSRLGDVGAAVVGRVDERSNRM